MAKAKDEYSQIAYLAVTESAANTLTFNSLAVFSNILEPRGLVIHRIQWNIPSGTYDLLASDADTLYFGLSGDDGLASMSMGDSKVYDYNLLTMDSFGTPANSMQRSSPLVSDFSNLPGQGRLVPADRIYIWVQGSALASAATIQCRIDFTVLDLDAGQYLELAQSLRILT